MKNNFKNQVGENSTKGFVVLFTVLIASVVLAMALGIANIALKQIVLTASSTDANKSFYAADTGIECALYHDIKGTTAFEPGMSMPISCGAVTALGVMENPGSYFTFSFDMQNESGNSCAYVSVDKTISNQTVATSRGVNSPCGTTNPRSVERVIEVTY